MNEIEEGNVVRLLSDEVAEVNSAPTFTVGYKYTETLDGIDVEMAVCYHSKGNNIESVKIPVSALAVIA
ncbi:hypothetical protein SAMN05421780_11120 [Flexibacter flexilis DSM 6793]|uniref:Uncharacterized protein n=1 Tax=Flexibacter flexilis DSM 6793 TaxID=927664 RepID=A0A1I1MZJ7_9BACT|nr:hypothetical protein [Flexibacter flexilis]SFC86970.1 hypothetical protein SAMN05421780_11120 [Flexibacter flexilis DSM 6793]